MNDSMEVIMLKRQLTDMEQSASMARSATLNAFIDLKVLVEEGEYEEALEMLTELTE